MTIIWPGCRPWVSSSSSMKPVGTPIISSVRPRPPRSRRRLPRGRRRGRRSPRRRAFGHGVDLGLGRVDDVLDVAAALRVAELDDAGAGLDQAAQHGPLGHDLGVVAGVGGGGDGLDELVQVGLAADAAEVAALGQLVGDGDGVGGLTAAVEVEDRVVDQLVRRAVEVGASQDLDAVGDGVLGQQHAAEHGLLGVDVLRRHPLVGGWALRTPTRRRSCSAPRWTQANPLQNVAELTCEPVDQRPPTSPRMSPGAPVIAPR